MPKSHLALTSPSSVGGLFGLLYVTFFSLPLTPPFPLPPHLDFHLLLPWPGAKTRAGRAHLRLIEFWQADPSAPSWGHAAVPKLLDAYLPKTHIHRETAGMQPPTWACMPTFIELQRDTTCGFTHTSTLTCANVWTALYKYSHFGVACRTCWRRD